MRASLAGKPCIRQCRVIQRAPFPGYITPIEELVQLYDAYAHALSVHKATVMASTVHRIVEESAKVNKRVEELIK